MAKLRQIRTMIAESFVSLWRNRTMSLASMVSIASMLILFGIVLLLMLNIDYLVYQTGGKIDKIVYYLDDNLDPTRTNEIINIISENDKVKEVKYVSKEEALADMKERLGEDADVLDVLEENALPASITVGVKDISLAKDLVNETKDLQGIYKVDFRYDFIAKTIRVSNAIKYIGIGTILILLMVCVLIIHNTIKIAVSNREREIGIMKYIGAGNWFIRGPFLMEGIVFGLVGAIVASGVVYFGYSYLFQILGDKLNEMLGLSLAIPGIVRNDIVIVFSCIGIGIGYFGSLASTKKFLKV